MWTEQYGPGGVFEFWSLGKPKTELVRLFDELELPPEGFSATVLGCGLGVEVDYIARRAAVANDDGLLALPCIAGVDFAANAIQRARQEFGDTPGAFFHHGDVCELSAPRVPLDLVIDNTVFQNMHRSGPEQEACFFKALRRISTPGRTVLHLNLMSKEGIDRRPMFAPCMEDLNLPALALDEIIPPFEAAGWTVVSRREGLYDLRPEGAGLTCEAMYTFGGEETPGVPSWWLLLKLD